MTDTRETNDTDPRYHAAFQRGYDGPAPERGARAEARFRRPGRREEAAPAASGTSRASARRAPLSATEPVLDAVRSPGPVRSPDPVRSPGPADPLERTAALPTGIDDAASSPTGADPEERTRSALDTRVPLALAVAGVVLVILAIVVVGSNAGFGYTGVLTEADQFRSYLFQFLPAPLATVGLSSIGAAIAVKAARS